MMKTLLTAACASALLAGAALAQSASPPYRSSPPLVQTDEGGRVPSRMNPTGSSNLPPASGAQVEPAERSYRGSVVPSGRRIGDQGQVPSVSNPTGASNLPPANQAQGSGSVGPGAPAYRPGVGAPPSSASREMRREEMRRQETSRRDMQRQQTTREGVGAGTSAAFGANCRGLASEEEVTRCLNQRSAELVQRGLNPDQAR